MPTNPVGTFALTDYTSMTGTAYPLAIDADMAVAQRSIDNFAPRPQTSPNMTVKVDPGHLWDGVTLTEKVAQNSASFTAPVTNPRIDRIVGDNLTGVISIVAGAENVSPVPPAFPAGKFPIAQVLFATSTTAITGAEITDERAIPVPGGASLWFGLSAGVITILKSFNIASAAYVSTGVFTVTFGPGSTGNNVCVSNTSNGGFAKGPALPVGATVIGPNNTVTFNVRDYTDTLIDPTTVRIIVV